MNFSSSLAILSKGGTMKLRVPSWQKTIEVLGNILAGAIVAVLAIAFKRSDSQWWMLYTLLLSVAYGSYYTWLITIKTTEEKKD